MALASTQQVSAHCTTEFKEEEEDQAPAGSVHVLSQGADCRQSKVLLLSRIPVYRGPRDQINIRILRSGSEVQSQASIPEIMVCGILMFMSYRQYYG